jgi:glycosyltransferase involved in cell wall biosynthesis
MDALRSIPGVEKLWERGSKASRADVVIRNLYPPRVADMDGQINLLNYAWEESTLPHEWVDDFNQYLDGLTVTSTFVKKIMIDNGVRLPVAVIGNGVDHLRAINGHGSVVKKDKTFTFLHVSSCFPRKGVDLLLSAFAETFTCKDDVSLVIKTFPNIHNTIEEQVERLKKSLFGLPMAEAMWHGLPVITTAYGGQSDFCTKDTSWLIDFSFQAAKTHMQLFNSVWMEPDVKHLGKLMHEVRFATREQLKPRLDAAKKLIEKQFTWDQCVNRLKELEHKIRRIKPLSGKKITLGWVSSWNSKCGIATYSKFLVDALSMDDFDIKIFASKPDTTFESDITSKSDKANVFRCWTDCGGDVEALLSTIAEEKPDVIVLQFNFAFFSAEHLEKIIQFTTDHGIVLIIFFHSTKDVEISEFKASLKPVTNALATIDRLLVHGIEDLNLFKSRGIYKNTAIFPHGVLNRLPCSSKSAEIVKISPEKTVIASYGFMLPHKGLEQLIEAFAFLKKTHSNLHLLMVNALYPNIVSDETKLRCLDLIKENQLRNCATMITDFLKDEESFALIDSASMVVFPYQATAESSSAAVRYGIATRCPVICTPLEIFSDVKDIVHTLSGTSSKDIAAGVEQLLLDPDLLKSKQQIQDRWIAAHSWNILGNRLGGMIKGLLST